VPIHHSWILVFDFLKLYGFNVLNPTGVKVELMIEIINKSKLNFLTWFNFITVMYVFYPLFSRLV
jgi:hypothetical protein